jgi:YVTN family beta-propeller protein
VRSLKAVFVLCLAVTVIGTVAGQARGQQECLYVLNQLDNAITFVDRATNKAIASAHMPGDDCTTPPCHPMPTALEYSPATGRAYVSRQDVNLLYVLDPVAKTVVDNVTIDSGSAPAAASAAAALSPNGATLYVANLASDSLSVINTSTNELADTIDLAPPAPGRARPRAVAVSPDGNTVLVGNSSDDNVSVINAANNSVIDTIPVGDQPAGIAFSPNGARAYVTNGTGASVSVIDVANRTVTKTIELPCKNDFAHCSPRGIAVSADGASVYVTNLLGGTVLVIDTASEAVSGDAITVGSGPVAVAIASDATVFVSNLMSASVSVIDPDSRAVQTIDEISGPFDLTLGPCPPPDVICIGDCDSNGRVEIGELVTGVNISLGSRVLDVCPSYDGDDDNRVSVSELVRAVNNALRGCPQ